MQYLWKCIRYQCGLIDISDTDIFDAQFDSLKDCFEDVGTNILFMVP